MIKIKISYEHPEELQQILKLFKNNMFEIKIPNEQKGKYKRLYVVKK